MSFSTQFALEIEKMFRDTNFQIKITFTTEFPWQLGSQDAATPMMQGIIDLHHDIFFFLILILVFVLIFCLFGETLFMERLGQGEGVSAGPSAPRGPAEPGVPNNDDSDPEKKRLQQQIRKAFVRLLKTYCRRYCKGMGFCGKYCARGRENFDYLGAADEIAHQEFFYQSPEADVDALRRLHNFIVQYNGNSSNWGDDMNEHFLFDLFRRDP